MIAGKEEKSVQELDARHHPLTNNHTTFVIVKRILIPYSINSVCCAHTHIEKHARSRLCTYLEQNADAEIHERLRKVNNTFPCIVDGHRGNS